MTGVSWFSKSKAGQGGYQGMARGEAFVTCPHCGSQSRIPVMALQRNNYHCSRCGSQIPLTNVGVPGDNQNQPPYRSRTKSQFQKRKRH
jgi:DNA-directed RNA polymerase subunit RPC12/RpoP